MARAACRLPMLVYLLKEKLGGQWQPAGSGVSGIYLEATTSRKQVKRIKEARLP